MTDNKEQWLTTKDLQEIFAGHRDNDIKVKIRGILVPLASASYHPIADCWVLEPYDGDDLETALAP